MIIVWATYESVHLVSEIERRCLERGYTSLLHENRVVLLKMSSLKHDSRGVCSLAFRVDLLGPK